MKLQAELILNVLIIFIIADVLSAQTAPDIVVILTNDPGYGSVN